MLDQHLCNLWQKLEAMSELVGCSGKGFCLVTHDSDPKKKKG